MNDLSKYIFNKRRLLGITQKQLAAKMSCSPAAIGSWELAKTRPSVRNLKLLAEILNAPHQEMIDLYFKRSAAAPLKTGAAYHNHPEIVAAMGQAHCAMVFYARSDREAQGEMVRDIVRKIGKLNEVLTYRGKA